MFDIVRGFDGFLFVGDVHLSSQRVGRRMDDYATAILKKLQQAGQIARERNLYPVLLGDLFHRAGENNLELLARVRAVSREEFVVPPLVLGGSHDRREAWFTDGDALKFLADTGSVQLIDQPGWVLTLDTGKETVGLWAAPAGSPIPRKLDSRETDRAILITHHDFDFCGAYPDALALEEIDGCDLHINGHMHTPAPRVMKGRTACYNPGSISRVSVDLKRHKPVVSVWVPAYKLSLEPVELEVVEDVFDLTGKEVFAATPAELKASLPKGLRLSSFAAKLRGAHALEAGRTDDGSVLAEELGAYFTLFDKPPVLKTYLTSLLADVVSAKK